MTGNRNKLVVALCGLVIVASGVFILLSLGPPRATVPEEAVKAAEELVKRETAAQPGEDAPPPEAPGEAPKKP